MCVCVDRGLVQAPEALQHSQDVALCTHSVCVMLIYIQMCPLSESVT
jgi:hypothetical protein